MENKNEKLLADFQKFCQDHPEQRFWQALRNWAEVPFVYVSQDPVESPSAQDTFYWTDRNEVPKDMSPEEFGKILEDKGKTI